MFEVMKSHTSKYDYIVRGHFRDRRGQRNNSLGWHKNYVEDLVEGLRSASDFGRNFDVPVCIDGGNELLLSSRCKARAFISPFVGLLPVASPANPL